MSRASDGIVLIGMGLVAGLCAGGLYAGATVAVPFFCLLAYVAHRAE